MPANRRQTGRECARVSTLALAPAPALPFALRRVRCADTLPAMESAPTDVLLVARCAKGDERALAELYDLFGRAAYALALRIVRDASQAEDVVQEAFLDLWRSAARFDPEPLAAGQLPADVRPPPRGRPRAPRAGPPAARRRRRRHRRTRGQGRHRGRRWSPASRARACAARSPACPPPQREVLELAYFNGLSQSEIAERLGEPLGTVKSRTHVALSRLRELLGEGFHA